jgi:hypothetical protein
MPTTTVDLGDDQNAWDYATAQDAPEPAPEAPSPEPIPEPEPIAPVETTGGRLKDPVSGKFVAKTPSESESQEAPSEATDAVEADEVEPTMPAQVPSWRLAEEAQKRRTAETQNAELTQALRQIQMQMAQLQESQQQRQEPAIDPVADPEAYTQKMQAALQREIESIRLESNLQIAQFKHGDVFNAAYDAFVNNSYSGDTPTYLRVMRSPNPGEALVKWYQERETLSQIGTDPQAWLQAELDKRMADPAFQAEVIKRVQAGTPSTQSQVQLPPSLSRATAAAPAVGAPDDASDAGIWAYATATR